MLQTDRAWRREELSRYQGSRPCEVCHGARLKPEALSVTIAAEDISLSSRRSAAAAPDRPGPLAVTLAPADLRLSSRRAVADALAWFSTLEAKLSPQHQEIARAI